MESKKKETWIDWIEGESDIAFLLLFSFFFFLKKVCFVHWFIFMIHWVVSLVQLWWQIIEQWVMIVLQNPWLYFPYIYLGPLHFSLCLFPIRTLALGYIFQLLALDLQLQVRPKIMQSVLIPWFLSYKHGFQFFYHGLFQLLICITRKL